MAQKAGLTRQEATRGVQERVDATLHAYPGLRLDPVPAQFLRTPPTEAGQRVVRGGRLREADDEIFEVVAELWRSSGCPVSDAEGLDGRLLVVDDPAGYSLTVTRHGTGDPILTVASPAFPAAFVDRRLAGGLLAGLGTGCLGPCATTVIPKSIFPSLAGSTLLFWAWAPLFLTVAAACLYLPETRRFGAGLLAAGVLMGVTVASIFSG